MITIVRCPRCGSTEAESVEAVHVELDRMRCRVCGHSEVCDEYRIKDSWNERIDPALFARAHGNVLSSVRFDELWRRLGARGPSFEAFGQLRASYLEPHRAYHTPRHVAACLRLIDDEAVKALAKRPDEVEAALWYHDAIYDPRATNNEERSAMLAEDVLAGAGVAPEIAARIGRHVRATKAHDADDIDGEVVIDIDLSILGEAPAVFARFEEEIRREYGWVEPTAYRAGRSAVLQSFAARPVLFRTPVLRRRYEAQARTNLATALRNLTGADQV